MRQQIRAALRASAVSIAMATALGGCAPAQVQVAPPPSAPPASAREPRSMNVLLIVADDLGTRLGSYGAPVITPNIDRLAREGVQFDRAYCQFPWCAPSRASFLTGMTPDTTRVFDLQTPIRTKLPDVVTLPQYFKQNGYFSGRVGKIFHQGVPGGIGKDGQDDPISWTQVVNPRGRDKDAENGRIHNLTPGWGWGGALAYLADEGTDEEQTDGMVATETIRMVEANRDKPFFIAAGFYRPHVPEVVPKKYFDLYPIDRIELADETPESLAKIPDVARTVVPDNVGMTPAQQRQMIQAYFAAVSFLDAQVGRVLDAVRTLGLEKNTIVVMIGDHGYLLGEHGQWMKNLLWEEAARTPMIVRVPGAQGNGTASQRIVEFVDLYPTLLEAAGLPPNPKNEGDSLMSLLRQPNDRAWDKPAVTWVRGGRSVRTERWRYTEWEGGRRGRELYDHSKDPHERDNMADDPGHASIVEQLRAMLPIGPVETRPHLNRYRPEEDCIELPPNVPASVGRRCGGVVQTPAAEGAF